MKKAILAIAAAATLAVGTLSAPAPAEARCVGCAVGLGVLGGVIVGGAIANAYGPRCYWTRHRVWDGFGWRLQRARVCD